MFFKLHELACADKSVLRNIQNVLHQSASNEPTIGEFELIFIVGKIQGQLIRQYVFNCILDVNQHVKILTIALNNYVEGKFEKDWHYNAETFVTSCFNKNTVLIQGQSEGSLQFLLSGLVKDFHYLEVKSAIKQH